MTIRWLQNIKHLLWPSLSMIWSSQVPRPSCNTWSWGTWLDMKRLWHFLNLTHPVIAFPLQRPMLAPRLLPFETTQSSQSSKSPIGVFNSPTGSVLKSHHSLGKSFFFPPHQTPPIESIPMFSFDPFFWPFHQNKTQQPSFTRIINFIISIDNHW